MVKRVCGIAVPRIAIWLIGISVAMYPALHATDFTPSWSFRQIAWQINLSGHFRDFFYVIVVGTAISMTNLWDNMLHTGSANVPTWQRVIAITALAIDVIVLLYGTGHFVSIVAPLTEEQFEFDWKAIIAVLAFQMFIETIISYRNAGVITPNPLR